MQSMYIDRNNCTFWDVDAFVGPIFSAPAIQSEHFDKVRIKYPLSEGSLGTTYSGTAAYILSTSFKNWSK